MSTLFEPSMAANSPPRSDGLPHSLSSNIGKKKRGGRQLRQVVLSPELKFCIRQFAVEVGMPRLMEPTGFRDFRGWLERVSGPTAADAWSKLVQSMIEETASDRYRILFIKEEVVREIVRAIVVPRPGESAKLVSTNCGRQCARPRSGNTLMTILERILIEKGIVSANEIEAFMRDRSTPHAFMYRDMQHQQQNPARLTPPPPNASYPSQHRNMSLDAITSAPEQRVSQSLRYPFSDTHHRPSLDSPFRSSSELLFRPGPATALRSLDSLPFGRRDHRTSVSGPDGSSTSSQLRVSRSPQGSSSRLHFGGSERSGSPRVNPIRNSSRSHPDRLPSFQELEESLDKRGS